MHDHFKRVHSKLTFDATISEFGDPEGLERSLRSDSEAPLGDLLGVSDDPISNNLLCQGMKRRRDVLEAKKRNAMEHYDEKINALSKAIDAMEEQQVWDVKVNFQG